MNLPIPTSLNSVLMMAIGVVFFAGGVCHGIFYHDRVFSVGLASTGIGCLFLGLTDGFSDPTPRGKLLFRLAIVAFLVGIPIVINWAYEIAASEW